MLGAGPLQVPAIKALKNAGYYVICADYDCNAVGFEFADEQSITSTVDVRSIENLAQEAEVNYVITSTTDAPVRTAALVSEKLGLPSGISYEDAICATQKDEMRRRLAEHNVPIPKFFSCESFDQFKEAAENFNYLCVVKPADSAASRGVSVLNNALTEKTLWDIYCYTVSFSKKGVVMVEEKIDGPEVSVEAITIAGITTILSITDKLVTKPPYLVELGHTEPSVLPITAQEEILAVANKAIEAIGVIDGPSHTELMVTDAGPKVIEIAARLGGDYITSKLVPLSTGVDIVRASVCSVLGKPVDLKKTKSNGAAIRFITAKHAGCIQRIDIDDALYQQEGLVELELYLSEGDRIDSPHSSTDRIGHLLFIGNDARSAAEKADYALHRYVNIEIS